MQFDLCLHTLAQHVPTVGCIRIKANACTADFVKTGVISIVVVADASGSMGTDNRIENLRNGILRLGELSKQFESMRTELTVIKFNNEASIVFGPALVPSETEMKRLCMGIHPSGGTNVGKAMEMALIEAEHQADLGKFVHVILLTDGVDTSSLKSRCV